MGCGCGGSGAAAGAGAQAGSQAAVGQQGHTRNPVQAAGYYWNGPVTQPEPDTAAEEKQ